MCGKVLILVCLAACVSNAFAAVVPIVKCSASDSKCAVSSGQAAISYFANGIPELKIERLDPLHYEYIDASAGSLKLVLKDIDITGIRDCKIRDIQRDLVASKLKINGICDLALNGQYETSGSILIIPIQGKGKAIVKLNRIFVEVEADMGEKVKDSKKYWDIKTWKFNFHLEDKAEIELQDLFKEDEVLGRAARELLKNSPNEVIDEVGPPIVKALLTKVIKNVDKYFHKVPADELSLDP